MKNFFFSFLVIIIFSISIGYFVEYLTQNRINPAKIFNNTIDKTVGMIDSVFGNNFTNRREYEFWKHIESPDPNKTGLYCFCQKSINGCKQENFANKKFFQRVNNIDLHFDLGEIWFDGLILNIHSLEKDSIIAKNKEGSNFIKINKFIEGDQLRYYEARISKNLNLETWFCVDHRFKEYGKINYY